MPKTAYQYVNGNYYVLTELPCINNGKIIGRIPTRSVMSFNESESRVISSITINTIDCENLQTNKEQYDACVEQLRVKKIKQIDRIYNRFMMYMDYSVYDTDGKEIKHSVASNELKPIHTVYPLGITQDNEMVHHIVREFSENIDFSTKTTLPYGIMQCKKKERYQVVINDISIYQDLIDRTSIHRSSEGNCYAYGSHTIASSLENMVLIYSTNENGIVIQTIDVPYIPKKVSINLKILIDDIFFAYDDTEINSIIIDNNTTPDPGDPTLPGGSRIPEGDKKPIADGSLKPDENGFSDYYEKARSTTPGAYQVVYDEIPDDEYDIETMIKKYMVIADIPDIEIGEYVRYMRTMDISQL